MNVQNVSNVPSHIDEFLKGNNEKLTEIMMKVLRRLEMVSLVLNVKNLKIKWMYFF